MTAQRLDGKAFANTLLEEIREGAVAFQQTYQRLPLLEVILVGEDSASQLYVANKEKQALASGFGTQVCYLPESVSEADLLAHIDRLNQDARVDGILVQLPLPAHISEERVLEHIAVEKDVDGFHPVNAGWLWSGKQSSVPCTPLGCVLLLKAHLGDLTGKNAVVIGRSNIVGKPMAALLLAENATVTVCHSKTQGLAEVVKQADIVVAAVGKPNLVKGSWLKEGAVVLDVGINRITDETGKAKIVGDVDYEDCASVASAITPVPGGIGPLTIACLLKNTLACAYARERKTHE